MVPRTKNTPETTSEITVQNTGKTPGAASLASSHTEAKASEQATMRTSSRIANAANDLSKRIEKAVTDLRKPTSLARDDKLAIAMLIEEMYQNWKQQPEITTRVKTTETATQTDEPTIAVNEMTVKAIDKKQDLIINLLQKYRTYAQATAAPRPIV